MKNKLLVSMYIFILTIITTNVYATNMEMKLNQEEVKNGDTILITINVKNVTQENGINIIQGKLEYDKDVFEKVENKDFEVKNNWSIVYNAENTNSEGKFILLNLSEGKKEDEELAELKLKVKENAKSTNTSIKLTEVCTVDGENIVKVENNEKEIKIKGKFSFKNIFTIPKPFPIAPPVTMAILSFNFIKKPPLVKIIHIKITKVNIY